MEWKPVFEQVAVDLGSELVGYEQLAGGSSATVFALDLDTDGDLRHVVYRQYAELDFKGHEPGSVAIEYEVLETLHRAGFAVARPLLLKATDQYLITEFVEGTAEVAVDELPRALDQMVNFLVALHGLDPRTLSAVLPELEDPISASPQYVPDTDAGRRARAALAKTSLELNSPVVIHGDYWPGNVLWRDGQLAAVIDWEDCHLGDPLADLACARVELLCEYGDEAMEYFTEQYVEKSDLAQTNLAIESLPIWEIYVSSSALATMHLWGLDATDEARRRAETTAFFERAVQTLG